MDRVAIGAVVLALLLGGGRGAPPLDSDGFTSRSAATRVPDAAQEGPSVTLRMLLERTIFRIDVLTLELRLEGPAADPLRSLARTRSHTEETADSVAALVTDARRAYARLDFLRGFSLERFLDAIRQNAHHAAAAGAIDAETRDFIIRSLPRWYSFLEGRGVLEGDRMEYFIRGDSLTVHYWSPTDSLLFDQTDVGPERRRSVLGGYVAPGSDFREGLIGSLFEGEGAGAGATTTAPGEPDGRP